MIVSGIKILKTNGEVMSMVVKEFDKVLLKTGEMAYIVDVIVPAKAYFSFASKFYHNKRSATRKSLRTAFVIRGALFHSPFCVAKRLFSAR